MITRRTLLASTIAASFAARLGATPGTQNPDDATLGRLTFGATPASRDAIARMGQTAWLEDQLAQPAFNAAFERRLAGKTLHIAYEAGEQPQVGTYPALDEHRPLGLLHADPASYLHGIEWDIALAWPERARPGEEVIAAALHRAVHAPGQLREVMTQFWHDHFNVSAHKSEYTATFYPSYDRMLRENALGNIRALLGGVATSPAMLVYLNNDDSRASPANENFARELLELHTLGEAAYLNADHPRWSSVPLLPDGTAAGYIDEDVYEVARAFTGWTIGDGRWLAEGKYAPKTGQFHYEDSWHDPYQKRILAREMPPNRAPMADGNDVLDMLARHPATARHICTKLARRLLTDAPSEALITALTDTYQAHIDSPDQMAHLIRALVAHPDWAAPPSKLRRPFEFLTALYRASGAKISNPSNDYHWQLERIGWRQHSFPAPTGHPDTSEDWQSGTLLLRLTEVALFAHDDWFGGTSTQLDALPENTQTWGDLAAHWTTRLTSEPNSLPEFFDALGVSEADVLPTDPTELHEASATALAFAALTPAFFTR